MTLTAEDSAVMTKTRELCASIAGDPLVLELQERVERFIADDDARLQYQSVHQRGEELHEKQHAGVELAATEIREFEAAREALLENDVAREFLAARQELEALQKEIGSYVGLTLELGRVPTTDDLMQANGGCCSSGGCGC